MARATRWVLSRIAASGSPTSTVAGNAPADTSTSTSIGIASIPNIENVCSRANMAGSFAGVLGFGREVYRNTVSRQGVCWTGFG